MLRVSRLRGVVGRLAFIVAPHVAFPLSEQGRHAKVVISELNGWPACAPVNASPACYHDRRMTRGPGGFATPFPVRLFHPLLHAGLSRRFP